jgi:hypothetical protein
MSVKKKVTVPVGMRRGGPLRPPLLSRNTMLF